MAELMVRVAIVDRSGNSRTIDCVPGQSLLNAVRDAGMDDLQALCGGCCSCATCHVYVAPISMERLPPMSDDEDGLLSGSSHRTPQSRLACQVQLDEGHDGLEIVIAPEE